MINKFFYNIEKVIIKGDPSIISNSTVSINHNITEMANRTIEMRNILSRYLATNQSNQYKIAINNCDSLSRYLSEASEAFFALACRNVNYLKRLEIFNSKKFNIVDPKKPNLLSLNIQVNDRVLLVEKSEITFVDKKIDEYCNTVSNHCFSIRRNTDELGLYWTDPQYIKFKKEIYDLVSKVASNVTILKEYSDSLKKRIEVLK